MSVCSVRTNASLPRCLGRLISYFCIGNFTNKLMFVCNILCFFSVVKLKLTDTLLKLAVH